MTTKINSEQGNCGSREDRMRRFLRQRVTVEIDRPLGCWHPRHKFRYPVNYGFLRGVMGGDGEPLDVYVLGVTEPLLKFTGTVIGAILRQNDNEDKLVVAPDGVWLDQAQIAEQTFFVEQYFQSKVIAVRETSCGAIVYRNHMGVFEYLCVYQTRSGTYSIPKGHKEPFETDEQTAQREVLEEIGASVSFCKDFLQQTEHPLPQNCKKSITIFLAEAREDLHLQQTEIGSYQWLPYVKAFRTLPPWYHTALAAVQKYLQDREFY